MQLNFSHYETEATTYPYVPILDFFKAIFKDAFVRKQFINPIKVCVNAYKDFKDGKMFKIISSLMVPCQFHKLFCINMYLKYAIHLDQAKAYIKFQQYMLLLG